MIHICVSHLIVLLLAFSIVPTAVNGAGPGDQPAVIDAEGHATKGATRIVRIGTFQFPPMIFKDKSGEIVGIFSDLIRAIGDKENWQLEFIHGSWREGLDRLEKGEIDLMTSVAFKTKRESFLDYHSEPVMTAWGEVYVKQGSNIDSIFELGRKKIAVVEGDINGQNLRRLCIQFNVKCTFMFVDDFGQALDRVAGGEAVAAVVNSIYGGQNAHRYPVQTSTIVFDPFRIFFAATEAKNSALLAAIDLNLKAFKTEQSGVYNDVMVKWFGTIGGSFVDLKKIKSWATWIGIAIVIVFAVVMLWNWRLNKEIAERKKTHERLVQEVAERRRAEQALSRTEETFSNAINNTTEAIALFDADDGLVVWNEAYTKHWRGPNEKLIKPDVKIEELVRARVKEGEAPEAIGREKEYITERMALHHSPGVQLEIQRKDRWFILRESRTREGGRVVVITDITEQKSAERKLEVQRDELQILNQQKNTFFSIISHDLKGPFNSLLGYSRILSGEDMTIGPDKMAEYGRAVNTSAEQVFKLLENLLEWSRLQMDQLEFEPTTIDLKEIIDVNLGLFAPIAQEKSVLLTGDDIQSLHVFADAQSVHTVVRNLVNNAIKFTPAKGNVTVSVRCNKMWAEIEISDTGVGISSSRAERLFRLDEKTSTVGTSGETGTGLGLHLCKELIEKQGGEIRFKSTEGAGSTFHITLPLHTQKTKNLHPS